MTSSPLSLRSAQSPASPGFLRLVREEPATPVYHRGWAYAVGNALLEMSWAVWSVFDVLVITTGVYLGYWLFAWAPGGRWIEFDFSWWQTCLIQGPALVLTGVVFGLYEQQTLLRGSRILVRSVLTVAAAVAVTYLILYVGMYGLQSRRVLGLAAIFYLFAAAPMRLLACRCVQHSVRRFLIVGTERKSRLSPEGLGDGLSRRYELAGYVSVDPLEVGHKLGSARVLGTIDDIEKICTRYQIDDVVVGPGSAKNARALERALGCLKLGCRVTDLCTFYEQVLSEVPVAHLEPNWFLFADLKHYREAQLMMKRATDLIGAIVGLLLTLPLFPLIALIIRLDSAGPVFYSQVRVGRNGRQFRLYKFRTMKVNAESNGHAWATLNDPRVTRVGRYLRKTRLDELPQLWNILLGQMSIVGPRPERPEFVDELVKAIPFYNERHLIKPGLTGWAQINYRYGASVDDARRKLQLDLWYIKHMSVELDLIIFLRTLGTVFMGAR